MGDISLAVWAQRMSRRAKEINDRKEIASKVFLDRHLYVGIWGNRRRYFMGNEDFRLKRREEVNNRKLTKWL